MATTGDRLEDLPQVTWGIRTSLDEYQVRVLDMVARSVWLQAKTEYEMRLLLLPVPPPPPGVCPECLEPAYEDDERVAAGMKCGECAYGVPQGGGVTG